MYMPEAGRWNGVDGLADQAPGWTPYRFGFNNPLKFGDPSGNYESHYVDENGVYLGQDKTGSTDIRVVNLTDWQDAGGTEGAQTEVGTKQSQNNSTAVVGGNADYGPITRGSTNSKWGRLVSSCPDPSPCN
ncbi:MAG: hypothetical protein R3D00_14535 [Bacteroidia bacterium]